MSLLLDALKKTGSAQQVEANGQAGSGNFSGMSLEDLPHKTSATTPSASPAPASTPSPTPRSTGENLFAAKKTAPARRKFNYTLGIIPTALIIGTVLGTAGGIYVWIEIQPPKAVVRNSPPPTVAAYSAPAPHPAPHLVLPAEKYPPVVAQPNTSVETPAKIRAAAPAAQNRLRSSDAKRVPATESAGSIQIQRKMETDRIYSTLTEAYQAYQNGDLNSAWQGYRAVLQMDAKNRDALLGMAAIAQQKGQDDAAMQYYRQVLILDPRDPVALAGMSAFSTGDAAGKESRLKQTLAQSPQSAALHYALGNIYTEQSRWGDAQQAYFNAMRLEPGNALFAFSLATSLDHLGQKKVAAQYYGQALQIDSTGKSGFDPIQTRQRMTQLLTP